MTLETVVPDLHAESAVPPDAGFPEGTTWAVICLVVKAGPPTKINSEEWTENRLELIPTPEATRIRSHYFSSEFSALVYGTGTISKRWHRDLSACASTGNDQISAVTTKNLKIDYLALERVRVDVGKVHVEVVMVHVAIAGIEELPASFGDGDLAALKPLLNPKKEEFLPKELRDLLPSDMTFDPQVSPWFTLLRTAPDATFVLARLGAANGSSPKAAALTEQLANMRAPVIVNLSSSWDMQVGARGVGFTLLAEDRQNNAQFHDVMAPALVRSTSSDKLVLVFLQEILLSRLSAGAAATDLPTGPATTKDLIAVQTLQADIATYYAKVWWSTTGRGGKRDTDFNELQTSWDLRRRLDDLVAISESLRNVVATAVLRRTKRSQIALSWALGAVAALAVPQTVLAALQSASPATRSQFHGLFAESVLIRSALIMAGAVLLGLMVVLAYTGLLQVHQLSFVRTSLRRARIYTLARLRGDVQRT